MSPQTSPSPHILEPDEVVTGDGQQFVCEDGRWVRPKRAGVSRFQKIADFAWAYFSAYPKD